MTREVCVAATQFACTSDEAANVENAERLIRQAAKKGAQIILIQELFENLYFCQHQKESLFSLAKPREGHPLLARFSALAKELSVVLPVSFFERANNAHFNSVVVIDADGTELGLYRKTHIPDGTGYQEKFYFNPGDTGFKETSLKENPSTHLSPSLWRNGRTGYVGFFVCVSEVRLEPVSQIAICWDQWFPEAARAMALMGAEILFYPTAIGSEPQDPTLDSRHHWRRVMQGHAGANLVPVVASNRIGKETFKDPDSEITFYGTSFIAGPLGEIVVDANDKDEAVIVASFDLDKNRSHRAGWGVFRDRRPEMYKPLLTLDGRT